VEYHSGLIPNTFAGLEDSAISFVHVDVDIYQAVMDCCRFAFPRLVIGGIIVFDDYGYSRPALHLRRHRLPDVQFLTLTVIESQWSTRQSGRR
jgi:hypothetical protein